MGAGSGTGGRKEGQLMELEQNFATCRLLAALINCHWAALLVVVVAVAFAGFNLAQILCKCPTLRGESKESGGGRQCGAVGRHLAVADAAPSSVD